jgi:hypothetical protein
MITEQRHHPLLHCVPRIMTCILAASACINCADEIEDDFFIVTSQNSYTIFMQHINSKHVCANRNANIKSSLPALGISARLHQHQNKLMRISLQRPWRISTTRSAQSKFRVEHMSIFSRSALLPFGARDARHQGVCVRRHTPEEIMKI